MWPIPWWVTATQGNNKLLTFPSQPWAKTSKYEGSQTERQVGGDLRCPLSKPGSNHPPSGVVQWGTHHCWWTESDCINQLGGTGLQYELRVLQVDGPDGPPPRQATETIVYWWSHHPILGICSGQSADSRYKGLQWACHAAGHTDHNLWWEGTSQGGVQNY